MGDQTLITSSFSVQVRSNSDPTEPPLVLRTKGSTIGWLAVGVDWDGQSNHR